MRIITKSFFNDGTGRFNTFETGIKELIEISEDVKNLFIKFKVPTNEKEAISTLIKTIINTRSRKHTSWSENEIHVHACSTTYDIYKNDDIVKVFTWQKLIDKLTNSFYDDYYFELQTNDEQEIEIALKLGWEEI